MTLDNRTAWTVTISTTKYRPHGRWRRLGIKNWQGAGCKDAFHWKVASLLIQRRRRKETWPIALPLCLASNKRTACVYEYWSYTIYCHLLLTDSFWLCRYLCQLWWLTAARLAVPLLTNLYLFPKFLPLSSCEQSTAILWRRVWNFSGNFVPYRPCENPNARLKYLRWFVNRQRACSFVATRCHDDAHWVTMVTTE